MASSTIPMSDMNEDWQQMGIGELIPGFYDHPRFIEIEKTELPNLLDVYASYVATASFPESYLAFARETTTEICSYLYSHLAESRSTGMCMFASQMLSRILDEEGILELRCLRGPSGRVFGT